MQAIIIILLIVAVLLVIFTLQNSVEITIQLFFWELPNAPLVLVLITCIALGYLIALLYFYPKHWKLKREYNQMIKFNEELKELHKLNHLEKQKEKVPYEYKDPEGDEMDDSEESSFFND